MNTPEFKSPLTYKELDSHLNAIASEYPFVNISTIGSSLVGRPIPLVCIGEGSRQILYVGTHHGMEWMTSVILLRYIYEYCEMISQHKRFFGIDSGYLFKARKVYIVPMLNPDGTELQINGKDELNPLTERLTAMDRGSTDFSAWQANGRGVDLNHNYNAGFADYKPVETALGISGGAPTRYSGAHPESEPETAALCSFIRAADISLLITLHTQGGEVFYDYNNIAPLRAYALAWRIAQITGYKLAKPEDAASYGGLKDWFILEYNRPGFTIECGRGKNPLPLEDNLIIYSTLREVLLTAPVWI